MKDTKVYIVPHTHWDREWYMEREKSWMMLVEVIDELLYMLRANSDYVFMLDGQTLVLEDYFSIRPDRKEELTGYIKEGRVSIGPWYVLPDEFLVSGEAHIRNFLIGDSVCQELGGKKMTIGYLPDSFGHPSQMPQILSALGMNEMVFWRGLGPDINRTELRWKGLDGTVILGINLPFSYGIGACMPEDPDAFVERLKSKISMLKPLANGQTLLVMNGVDHVAPQRSIPDNIAYARKKMPGNELLLSGLQEYLDAVRGDAATYPETAGELRSGYRAYLLGGTLSTRMYLKKENFTYETLLERYAEPLCALAGIYAGITNPKYELRHAWKAVLSNQPHDSICGCSFDAVHDEMMLRYRWMHDIGASLLQKAGTALFEHREPGQKSVTGSLVVFNPHLQTCTDIVTAELTIDERLLRKVNYETGNLDEFDPGNPGKNPEAVLVRDARGNETRGRVLSVEDLDDMVLSLDTQPEMRRCKLVRFAFPVEAIPALSFTEYTYEFLYDAPQPMVTPSGNSIENESFKVTWDKGLAALAIEDKNTGHIYTGQNCFEDSGDAGDEYTFSRPLHDTSFMPDAKSIRVGISNDGSTSVMVIDAIMRIPEGLTADRRSRSTTLVNMKICTSVELSRGIGRIDIRTEVDNKARDHRLRVLFKLGSPCAYSSAEGIFSVDDRPITPADTTAFASWVEPPSTNPQKTFTSIAAAGKGLTIANRGLPEYELYGDENGNAVLALTLLRGVGWLSRPDLLARKGNGGWTIATPGAQCLGTHVFEYSIIPHANSWAESKAPALAHSFAVPPMAFPKSSLGPKLGNIKKPLISIDSDSLVLSAFKKSESGDGYIVRFWNESAHDIDAQLEFGLPLTGAWLVNMAEHRLKALDIRNGKCTLSCGAWKVLSLELVF